MIAACAIIRAPIFTNPDGRMAAASPTTSPGVAARLFVALQYVLPQRALCRVVYWAARWQLGPAKNLLIAVFTRLYPVNTTEAQIEAPQAYPSFNAFFTRGLKDGARPLAGDDSTVVSPADGRLTEFGSINDGRLLQAKGSSYSVDALLGGGDVPPALRSGEFATIYLAPHDYHRVHMPTSGTLRRMSLVPGKRFSVNRATTALVTDLFARNERVVCWFETAGGPLAVVLVGALNVASISTVWHGQVTGPRGRVRHWDYADAQARHYPRGAELGQFNLGSTVIVVAGAGLLRWEAGLGPQQAVRMGQALGRIHTSLPSA
jgi:phosphatidylserine decarboxylase